MSKIQCRRKPETISSKSCPLVEDCDHIETPLNAQSSKPKRKYTRKPKVSNLDEGSADLPIVPELPKPKRQYTRKPKVSNLDDGSVDMTTVPEPSKPKRQCTRKPKVSSIDDGSADLPTVPEPPKPKRQYTRKPKGLNVEDTSADLATITEPSKPKRQYTRQPKISNIDEDIADQPSVQQPPKTKRQYTRKPKALIDEIISTDMTSIKEPSKPKRQYTRKAKITSPMNDVLPSTSECVSHEKEPPKTKRKYTRKMTPITSIDDSCVVPSGPSCDSCELPQIKQTIKREKSCVGRRIIDKLNVESIPNDIDLMKITEELKMSDDDDDEEYCMPPLESEDIKKSVQMKSLDRRIEDVLDTKDFKKEFSKTKSLQRPPKSKVTRPREKTKNKRKSDELKRPFPLEGKRIGPKAQFGVKTGSIMPSNYIIYDIKERPIIKTGGGLYTIHREEPKLQEDYKKPDYESNDDTLNDKTCPISPELKPEMKISLTSAEEKQKKKEMYLSILRDLQSSSEDESKDICNLQPKIIGLGDNIQLQDIDVSDKKDYINYLTEENILNDIQEQEIDSEACEQSENVDTLNALSYDPEVATENISTTPCDMEIGSSEMVVQDSNIQIVQTDWKTDNFTISDSEISKSSSTSTSTSSSSKISTSKDIDLSQLRDDLKLTDTETDSSIDPQPNSCSLQSHSMVDQVSEELKSTNKLSIDQAHGPYIDLSMIAEDLRLTDTETETSTDPQPTVCSIMSSKAPQQSFTSDIDLSRLRDDLRLTDTETESETRESIINLDNRQCVSPIKVSDEAYKQEEFDENW